MFSFKSALAGGGAVLTAGAFLLGNLTGEQVKPVERIAQPALAPAEQICPDGWEDTSTGDGHLVVLSCSRDEWLVILNPDRSFNYAWRDGAPDFTYDKSLVPEWPR